MARAPLECECTTQAHFLTTFAFHQPPPCEEQLPRQCHCGNIRCGAEKDTSTHRDRASAHTTSTAILAQNTLSLASFICLFVVPFLRSSDLLFVFVRHFSFPLVLQRFPSLQGLGTGFVPPPNLAWDDNEVKKCSTDTAHAAAGGGVSEGVGQIGDLHCA